ncbi:MAG: ATP-binding protein [Planctomycetota bacterium]
MSENTLRQLGKWLEADESEHMEFKEAKGQFDSRKPTKYCCAIANEGGGKVILGVTDKRPRVIVGTNAFPGSQLKHTKSGLVRGLHVRIDAEELQHPDGRVLVFHVPARPAGMPIQVDGAYWMRSGDSLAPMTPDMLKRVFDEDWIAIQTRNCW